jgi:rhamnogalacturonyl hydrolase YesR
MTQWPNDLVSQFLCWLWGVALAIGAVSLVVPAHAVETVTLAPRQFAPTSPAAPSQRFFSDARRLAASTTPDWKATDTDLSAWGPALIFPLLDRDAPKDAVLSLAAPLEEPAPAPTLLFRTIGLYAAKSRLPFTRTPTLMRAINRNLGLIGRAARDLDTLAAAGPELRDWSSIGVGAWVAYLDLLYRDYGDVGAPGATRWNAEGLRMLEGLMQQEALADGKGFRRNPREDELSLWPSALMIYALVKAYENEEAVKYEAAAIAAAAAVERLHAENGSYFSTAARTHADTRANAYLAGALLLLAKDTGDPVYRERAAGIIRWLTSESGAGVVAHDAKINSHVAYLILLIDSLATRPYENVLGRRPMRVTAELGAASARSVAEMIARLRPDDFRYRNMFDAVFRTLFEHVPQAAGDFAYDYGDSPGYAASVLLTAGDATVAPQIVAREERLLSWPRPRTFDEMAFGTGALFAALDHDKVIDAAAAATALRRYLCLSGGIAFADRYYLDWLDWFTGGGGYEYGPTVLGAQIASTHLHYAERFPGQNVGWWLRPLQLGRALLEGANAAAWDAERHIYRARPGSDAVRLLPNAMMILDLLQAHQVTGEAAYRERAEEVARGLDALWDGKRGGYFASSEQMGDAAYESLSTNSYAALAFVRLYDTTKDPGYRERALAVFDFISRDLYADGVVYHHLYRGHRCAGDIWCVGCNWRILAELMELATVQDKVKTQR